jgi:hypothetical protein
MGAVKKSFVLFFIFILSLCAISPMPRTYATATINRFVIQDTSSYLIAGYEYTPKFESDAAGSTTVERIKYEYSTDNGATWINLPTYKTMIGLFDNVHFMLPIDPQLVSAKFRVSAYFSPIIGSNSYSEKTIGPYKILQPGSPSELIATPNMDSSVTLTWNDNSNMESYYQITRDGPDGPKTFYVDNTTETMGPLSFIDKATDPYVSTIYVYSVSTVIDNYNLLESNRPGIVNVLVKTKARSKITDNLKITDKLQIDKNMDIYKLVEPDNKIKLETSIKFNDKWSQYILNVDKVAVNSVTLNKKAITLEMGESETLTATVSPSNAVNQKVTWSSDNKEVADVDSAGKVTGISSGSAKITLKTADGGFTDVCVVIVMEIPEVEPAIPDMPMIGLKDISEHWASSAIKKAVALGIVNGYPDGTFRPDEGVTRAEFTSMLMNGLKPATEGSPLTFQDKNKIGAWAVQSVEKAVKLGVISGYKDGTFRPNANITHAEMISMVVRASGLPTDNTQPTSYVDDADIPGWAKAAVSTAEKNGIIIVGGNTGDTFAPQVLSTRAEAATAIIQMLMIGE